MYFGSKDHIYSVRLKVQNIFVCSIKINICESELNRLFNPNHIMLICDLGKEVRTLFVYVDLIHFHQVSFFTGILKYLGKKRLVNIYTNVWLVCEGVCTLYPINVKLLNKSDPYISCGNSHDPMRFMGS